MKNNKGITLIALVVTIIVLLILAGVSITMLSGQNGILNRASEASWETKLRNAADTISYNITESITNYYNKTYNNQTADGPASIEAAIFENLVAPDDTTVTLNNGSIRAATDIDTTAKDITLTCSGHTLTGHVTKSGVKWDANFGEVTP